jgi:hypothetical protein
MTDAPPINHLTDEDCYGDEVFRRLDLTALGVQQQLETPADAEAFLAALVRTLGIDAILGPHAAASDEEPHLIGGRVMGFLASAELHVNLRTRRVGLSARAVGPAAANVAALVGLARDHLTPLQMAWVTRDAQASDAASIVDSGEWHRSPAGPALLGAYRL